MRRTLNTLKPDLKKFVNFTLLCFILASCKTTELKEVTNNIEKGDSLIKKEYELPAVESPDYSVGFSEEVTKPLVLPSPEVDNLPVLDADSLDNPEVSEPIKVVEYSESDLSPLEVVIKSIINTKPKPAVKPKVNLKPKAKPLPNAKTKAPIVAVPAKNSSVTTGSNDKKIEPVTIESKKRTVIVLSKKDVVVGKVFTIEMDQTGWLYEKQIKGIKFENKYYTSDTVLFKFFAQETGKYTVEFVKYDHEGSVYSTVEVNALDVDSTTERLVESEKSVVITPKKTKKHVSEKSRLEKALADIDSHENPDEVYFKLANIYYDEGLLKKSKELYEYIYDNYPLSQYYDESEEKMNYIIDNFLKVR